MGNNSTSFFSQNELSQLGFKTIGSNCLVSKFAQFYNIGSISMGDNVRIDDFCILSGQISLGSNIHISAGVKLFGSKGIILEDFSGISSNSIVYSAMDDFSGDFLVGSIHPDNTTHVTGGNVIIRKYTQIGANCVVFPNVEICEGSVVGAMSLIKENISEWGIYAGIPAKRIKDRRKGLLKYIDTE